MANQSTQKAIQEEFLDQLGHKPLNKITVSSIVQNCRINRNTFYYYYQDIYDLLQDILNNDMEKTAEYVGKSPSWEEGYLYALQMVIQNRSAMTNLYRSDRRELLHDYLYKNAGIIVEPYIRNEIRDLKPRPEDVKLLTILYQCALTEVVERWLESGVDIDAQAVVKRIGEFMNGTAREALSRSASLNN